MEADHPDFPLVLTAAEMRAADATATRDLGLPSLLLMENAGRGVAELIRREMGGEPTGAARAGRAALVAIVCGGGSNGGDGFVVARHLARAGVPVRVLLTAARGKIGGDAALALGAVERMFLAVEDGSAWTEGDRWQARLREATVVVDAIFGTGFHGPVTDAPAAALQAMNEARAIKIAIDVPSGLDADTGRAEGVVFRADLTATIGAWKIGLLIDAAAEARCRLIDDRAIAARLPHRGASANKGSSGHLLVVAGSSGKTGAALLVGQAALRAGAGLVTIATTAAGQIALDAKVVELMTARYTEGDDADPTTAVAALTALTKRAQALAIGPGIPPGARMRALVRQLAARLSLPMVIDADALNALGTDAPSLLAGAPSVRILTPHPGEMGRLLGIAISDVQADRLGHARRLAVAAHATVVLKGARTVIAAPDGLAYLSPTACGALATAGSGDVLCLSLIHI